MPRAVSVINGTISLLQLNEYCEGANVTIPMLPGYTDGVWLNQSNGEVYYGEVLEIANITQYTNIEVQAIAPDGCKVRFFFDIPYQENGIYADIFPNDIVVCLGGNLSVAALPEFTNVIWTNGNTGEVTVSNTIELENLIEPISIYVTAENGGDCPLYQEFFLYPQEQFTSDLIIEPNVNDCSTTEVVLTTSNIYENVIWQDLNTGEVTQGSTYTIPSSVQQVYLQARGDLNGCTYIQDYFFSKSDENIFDNNLLSIQDFRFNCPILNFEANDGYTNYEWYVLNQNTGEFDLRANGQFATIDFSNIRENSAPLVRVQAINEDGCTVEYLFEFIIWPEEKQNLIDYDSLGSYCTGDVLTLTTTEEYVSYTWEYRGNIYDTPTFVYDANNDPVFLRVEDANGCQYSTTFLAGLGFLDSPSLCLITTEAGTDNNVLLWETPPNGSNISEYLIYREGSSAGDFDLIGTQSADIENRFTDTESDPNQQAYRYYLRALNSCGDISEPSNIHKTIHLTINQGTNDNINLIWDSYSGVEYDQIKILRGDNLNNLQEYVVLPSNVLSFTDQNPPSGDVFYQLEITTVIECNTGKASFVVRSNVAEFLESDSTEELSFEGSIYPNPFDETLRVELTRQAQLSLYTAEGQLVLNKNLSSGKQQVETTNLPQGIYLIKVIQEGTVYSQSFIKL